ncbi:MAG TPA: hypothetical protein VKS20_02530 [Candidatus Acidoferrales bacterium]|nr:hypothetical protein [Candidatus Acidoferrales bacterium]
MRTSKRLLARAFILTCSAAMAIAAEAQLLQPGQQQPLRRMQPAEVRELPPEMGRRFSNFHAALQPSARAWVEQARIQAQKGTPDVQGLESAIHGRFPQLKGSSGAMTGGTLGTNFGGGDIEAMVFVVLMDATKNMDQDLKTLMGQVNAIKSAKDSLRSLQSSVQQESAHSGGKPNTPCRSPFCLSLSARLAELSASTANLPRPVRLQSPAEPTYANLQVLQNSLKSQLDSMSEMSDTQSLLLQMSMDRRSKFMETLSNIMKKTSDTQSSILSNLK